MNNNSPNNPNNRGKSGLNRRGLLKSAAVAGWAAGVASVFQNCSPVNMSSDQASSSGVCDTGTRAADNGVNTIDGQTVNPVVPGSDTDIYALHTEVLHRSQLNANADNSQKMLIVGVGPDVANGNYAPIKFDAGNSLTGVAEILCYISGVTLPVLRRVFNAGDVVPETMFLLDSAIIQGASSVTVVVKDLKTGYWKKDFPLDAPVAYKDYVGTWTADTPYGGSSFLRPYVAGSGLASGGQGDLGALHTPMFSLTGDDLDLSLGVGTTHPKFGENHYVAGAGIYDQNGHPIGPVATIMYGSNYPNFSHATFQKLRLADRGTRIVRGVIFDTYNGYLMGFFKV